MTPEEKKERKKIADKKYYEKNKEKRIAQKLQWVRENKERQAQYQKQYKQEHPELQQYKKAWAEEHKEELREKRRPQKRAWQAANRDKYNKSIAKWREANPEKVKEYAQRIYNKIKEESEYLSAGGVAKLLGLNVKEVYSMLNSGVLPYIKPERIRYVPREFIESILKGEDVDTRGKESQTEGLHKGLDGEEQRSPE